MSQMIWFAEMRQMKYWLLINAAGLVTYLYFASWIWARPSQENLLGGPGDPIIYMLSAFPILAACASLDLIWGVLILLRMRHNKNLKPIMVWLTVGVVWVCALTYDSSRQYTG
jgi:hypothetical protein